MVRSPVTVHHLLSGAARVADDWLCAWPAFPVEPGQSRVEVVGGGEGGVEDHRVLEGLTRALAAVGTHSVRSVTDEHDIAVDVGRQRWKIVDIDAADLAGDGGG